MVRHPLFRVRSPNHRVDLRELARRDLSAFRRSGMWKTKASRLAFCLLHVAKVKDFPRVATGSGAVDNAGMAENRPLHSKMNRSSWGRAKKDRPHGNGNRSFGVHLFEYGYVARFGSPSAIASCDTDDRNVNTTVLGFPSFRRTFVAVCWSSSNAVRRS